MTISGRVDNILKNEDFKQAVRLIEQTEADRIYCRHGLAHLLDVARIGALLMYEKAADMPDLRQDVCIDIVYAAALVHDLGRAMEYEDGTPHDRGSVIYARKILPECGFDQDEVSDIVHAVSFHRTEPESNEPAGSRARILRDILYTADKKSRLCFTCGAAETCKWSDEKKNKGILY